MNNREAEHGIAHASASLSNHSPCPIPLNLSREVTHSTLCPGEKRYVMYTCIQLILRHGTIHS